MNISPKQGSDASATGQAKATANNTRRRLIWLGSIALLVVVVLVGLPIMTARVATTWLQDNGAPEASIGDVDINLFTGTVRLLELQASGGAQQRLHIGAAEVDVRWWPLASKRIHVEALRLMNSQIDVAPDADGNWQVGGLIFSPAAQAPEPETASAEFDWGIGSEIINLSNVSITYRDALFDTDVEIEEISIGSHFSWQAGEETELVIDMTVNDSPINLRSTLVPWGELQSISGNLQLQEHALADHGQVLQQLAGLEAASGLVSMDLEVTASLDQAGVIDVLVTGPLEIVGVSFTRDTLSFSVGQMDWQGQIDVKFPVVNNEPLVSVEGAIQLADTQVALADLALEARLDAVDYSGLFELYAAEADDQAPLYTLAASLSGEGLAVDHGELAYELARLESFSLNQIQLDDLQRATVAQLQLAGLRLMGDVSADSSSTENSDADDTPADNRLFSFAQLDLQQLAYDAEAGVMIESVMLGEPVLAIVRQAGGEINRLNDLLTVFAGEPGQDTRGSVAQVTDAEVSGDSKMNFALNSLNVQATDLLDFEDASVSPPVNFLLTGLELALNNINSGSTDPVNIVLKTGNSNMTLDLAGDIVAFTEPMSANLLINIDALELPRFSPYIPGYNIDRGRLSVDSAVSINGETLDIKNSVLLEGIQLAGKGADDNSVLAQGMAMPLDVALDLLRDSDDRIQLDLPVTGSLSDPEFNSADIIRTVMQNALQNAAMSYVTNALQPLGTLLFIGGLASQAAEPRFAPLEMTAGESDLSDENRDYLLKISELLTERPRLQLTLCGIVTEADRGILAERALRQLQQDAQAAAAREAGESAGADSALDSAPQTPAAIQTPGISDGELLELAAMRTGTATSFLTDTAMIESARLFTCRETIDAEEDARPRVRLSL